MDALDAFMRSEVLPEVVERVAAEAAAKMAARAARAEALAAAAAAGLPPPPLPGAELGSEGEEEAEAPALVLEVPTARVKLLVGAGGETIKWLQKKSKARIQVAKTEAALGRGFGTGAAVRAQEAAEAAVKAMAAGVPGRGGAKGVHLLEGPSAFAPARPDKGSAQAAAAAAARAAAIATLAAATTRVELRGSEEAVATAARLIGELLATAAEAKKEQHVAARDREKERKAAARRAYHARHARDYELLELPVGASKEDVKKAYRRLALLYHPDRHPEGPAREAAAARFVVIQAAHDALMNSDEEASVEALGFH